MSDKPKGGGTPRPAPRPGTPAGDNRANQLNPNNPTFHTSRGTTPPSAPPPPKK